MSRTKNTVLNFLSKSFVLILSTVLSFISRTIFIKILGNSYLGVNGLLSNVLMMLSLSELGIGTAITFSLYKPIAENNKEGIKALMHFYKNAYRVIGIFVFVLGLILMLFLDYLVPDPGNVTNLKLIFIIYVVNSTLSYFITYKNTLLIADQKEYLLLKSNTFFSILNIVLQILSLILFRNYIIYLLVNVVVSFIQRVYVNYYITQLYPYLNDKEYDKLDKSELRTIIVNVKAMIYHKIGDYCINGTDNIIISMFHQIISVGIYSNYNLIFTSVNGFIGMIYSSMTASMGNFIASESDERKLEIYKVIDFIGFWLYGFSAVCFYVLITPFITLWIGNENLLSHAILIVLVINNYMFGMRVPLFTIKSAAGIYDQDKFVPMIQSIVNLVVSIILIQKVGLIGVFLGTLISGLVPSLYRPYIVYKEVFKISSISYYIQYFKNIIILIFVSEITSLICSMVNLSSNIVQFGMQMCICVLIPNIIFLLLFYNKDEFKYIVGKLNKVKKVV